MSPGNRLWTKFETNYFHGSRNYSLLVLESCLSNPSFPPCQPTSSRFSKLQKRLYKISNAKFSNIKELGYWEGNTWVWNLPWRRHFFQWEQEMLRSFMEDIQRLQVTRGEDDKWRWKFNADGIYSVNSAYKKLTEDNVTTTRKSFNQIWDTPAPLKVSGFSWQLLHRRLPTRSNLGRMNMILNNSGSQCPMCTSAEETEQHLLFTCAFATKVWNLCDNWWGLSTVRQKLPGKHLLQHQGFIQGKLSQRIWTTIWLAAVWSIWIERNNKVFRGIEPESQRVMDLIMLRSWFWVKAKIEDFRKLLPEWILDPLSCVKSLS